MEHMGFGTPTNIEHDRTESTPIEEAVDNAVKQSEDPDYLYSTIPDNREGMDPGTRFRPLRDSGVIHSLKRAILNSLPRNQRVKFKDFLYHLRSFIESREWDVPSNVAIETTTDCNRHCAYCPLGNPIKRSELKTQFMSRKLYLDIIEQLSAVRFSGRLALQGYGEPLLDPDIIDRIGIARKQLPRAYITLNSNGDKLTTESLQMLVEAGLDHIYVTNHSSLNHAPSHIQRIMDDPFLSKYLSYFQRLIKLENRGGAVNLVQFEKEGRVSTPNDIDRCISNIHTMTINVDGSVSFCCNDFDRRTEELMGVVGSDSSTVMDIWNDEQYRNYRNAIRDSGSGPVHPICTRCNLSLDPIPKE